jgi:hypothetical protein
MVVNSCQEGQKIDNLNKLSSYAERNGTVTCNSHQESVSAATGQTVWQKLLTTNFNPTDYYETGKL